MLSDEKPQRLNREVALARVIGIVSHDLRNPLFTIGLAAHNLRERGGFDDRASKNIARIQSSADRATRLVSDLLDFTQARLGQGIPVAKALVNLHDIVERCVDEVKSAFANRQVICAAEGDCHGEWEADRLSQVVHNLVTNALKYGQAGSPVHVRSRAAGNEALIEVHNVGIPIPEEHQSDLFKPLNRGGLGVRNQVASGLDCSSWTTSSAPTVDP